MDEASMRLPIRLLPRRGNQVFRILFFAFFFGFAIFWITMAATMLAQAPTGNDPFPGFHYIFPLFGLPFMIVGAIGLFSAVMKLLPGSPYYYVEVAPGGVAVRKAWKIRRFAWAEISPFDVAVKIRRTKGGKVTTYWVVAQRAGDAMPATNDNDRYNRSVLQIDAGEYGAGNADMAASALVDWLNGLQSDAVAHPGRLPSITAIPPDFRGRAIEVRSAAVGAGVASPSSRRSGVIER